MTTSNIAFSPELPAAFPQPASDFSDLDLIHRISVELIGELDREALYGKIVDAAVSITGSQFGTMQLLCPSGHASGRDGELQLLYSHGLPAYARGFWEWVSPAAYSSCTLALKLGERAVIPDFELWDEIAGTDDLMAFRRAGIRSAQTTPLKSRDGKLLGMISTHWDKPHQPTERDLRLLDILARQAADLLERTIADEALRAREQELETTCAMLRRVEDQQRQAEINLRLLNDTLEQHVTDRTTKLMQAEDKLRQSQKMDAVGQLTGGIAHDFNNLLAGISGSLELIDRRIKQGRFGDVEKYTATALSAVNRAAALTHRLLAFSRQQTLAPKPTNVNILIYDLVDLIKNRTVGPGIQVDAVGADDLWPALVDASQLENALLNLCINARDAMPDGGSILVETSNELMDRFTAESHDLSEGEYLRLSVSDTGTGMTPEVVARIFEPFFTTKPIGEGTGLGLSMIYGFAQQSGGQIRVRSQLGEGTTVSVYLPRHCGEISLVESPMVALDAALAAQGETILLVDDEPTVRMLLANMLGELGYTVIEASDSEGGLKLLRSDVEIDLLVTDIGLPGCMNGRQMADAGMLVRPGIKTLFISGYAETAVPEYGELQLGMQVLTKPFAIKSIGNRIREILSSANSATG